MTWSQWLMIRICYILWNNAPQSELTCISYQVLWNSQIFRGENYWSGRGWCKSATNIQESVHSTVHCKPCHHPIQEQSQGDCRSPFWSSWAINKIPQKPSEIRGEGTSNLSHWSVTGDAIEYIISQKIPWKTWV